MATINIAAGKIAANAKTLVAATVDTVTFADDVHRVEVYNAGTGTIYFTTDGSTPVAAADGTWELPANTVRQVDRVSGNVVKLISAGTPTYTVTRLA